MDDDTHSSPAAVREPTEGLVPTKVGRFALLHRIGAGGMGVVYAVYDDRLDRRVALKMIGTSVTDEARGRLKREAQGLAKLAHPNVVPIYEVGEHDGRPFLVMEYVHGRTLRQWLADASRSAAEILDKYAQAGRGLAAAHELDLVHRDFKPDNAIVGADGRVRVLDFGLVRRAAVPDETPTSRGNVGGSDALAVTLTSHDVASGTLGYAAPEQQGDREADARADQFAFCVSLWEALCGERPYAGKTPTELAEAIAEGRLRPPPKGAILPGWVRPLLQRGLSPGPEMRWPSMSALLSALHADPSRRRRRIAAGVGIVAIAGLGAFGWQLDLQRRKAACVAEGDAIDELWNDEARADVRDGLLAVGIPQAATTARRVLPRIDALADAWRELGTEACMAATVEETWEPQTTAAARWCLDRARGEIERTIGLLSSADRTIHDRADLETTPRDWRECLDPVRLSKQLTPPTDTRPAVEAAHAELLQATLLAQELRFEQALPIARHARELAVDSGWAALPVEVDALLGLILSRMGQLDEAETLLEDTYFAAAELGAFAIAGDAARSLGLLLDQRARSDEARSWVKQRIALHTLTGQLVGIEKSDALHDLGEIERHAGRYEDALRLHLEARAVAEDALGPDHTAVSASLHGLASTYGALRRFDESIATFERGLAIVETSAMDELVIARFLAALGRVESQAGRASAAREHLQRAASIAEARGENTPFHAFCRSMLTLALIRTRDFDAALPEAERALAINESTHRPGHPEIDQALRVLTVIRQERGDFSEALQLALRAAELIERRLGSDHRELALALEAIGDARLALGDLEAARVVYERALAVFRKHDTHERRAGGDTLVGLAELARQQGRIDDAIALAESVVSLPESFDADTIADGFFVLARTLTGKEPARARTLAEQSRAWSIEADLPTDEIDAWLAAHPAEAPP